MLMKIPQLEESYFVSSFVSGLKEEIKPMLKMLKLTELSATFETARLQEYSLQFQNRHTKKGPKSIAETKFRI